MDTPLHALAAANDGVVTRATAAAAGYAWPAFRAVVANEGWTRLRSAAYVPPGTPVTLRTLVRAEQLGRPALVASHRTAARLYDADVLTDAFEFLSGGDARHDVTRGRVRRTTWAPGDVVDLAGLRVTSPARTASDLLRIASRDEAVCAVDGLLRCETVTLDAVAARLEAGPARYRARAWAAFARLDPRSGSVAESLARLRFRDAGLWPRTQVTFTGAGWREIRADFWFAGGVVVEIEGYAFHSSRDDHQRDIARFNALGAMPGLTVLRFSRDDVVRRPGAVVAAVRGALARRAHVRPIAG